MVLNNTCECMHTLCKYAYGLVYIHIHIHIHMYICICIHAYIDIYIHTYTYTHIYAWIYIYIHMHIYVHIYIYMHIYMYMHICIYISPQLVHARLCNRAAASLPWKLLRTYLESCANIVRLSFPPALLPFRRAGRPPAGTLPDLFA